MPIWRFLAVAAILIPGSDLLADAPPPPSLSLDPFYAKHVDAGGIPVVSSAQVPDEALTRAQSIVLGLLEHRPDLLRELASQNYRVAILAESEGMLDIPEFAHWTRPAPDDPRLTRCEKLHYDERIGRLTDAQYWNARARGIGGPMTVGAAEDLLGLPTSRYYGETIFVHEFAHNVLWAAKTADSQLYADVVAAYRAALAEGLWSGEYMTTTVDEYWAEGTQLWFNSKKLKVMDGRRILSHEDLEAYDPRLYAVLARAYGASHRLAGDPFYLHAARIPAGPIPQNTAEVC
jgi:hypothetical protein